MSSPGRPLAAGAAAVGRGGRGGGSRREGGASGMDGRCATCRGWACGRGAPADRGTRGRGAQRTRRDVSETLQLRSGSSRQGGGTLQRGTPWSKGRGSYVILGRFFA